MHLERVDTLIKFIIYKGNLTGGEHYSMVEWNCYWIVNWYVKVAPFVLQGPFI